MTFKKKINDSKNLVRDCIQKYPNIIVGCSFGKDSMVLLDIVCSVKRDIPIFSVMANTEFPETYTFARVIVEQYKLNYKSYTFWQDNGQCCGETKVEKTKEALQGYHAWISGIRKTEGITRRDFQYIEEKNGLVKINPILDFTETDIWRYLATNQIPVHPLYRDGYRSLGCSLCSTPEKDENETERAGRWRGTKNACGECGIHSKALR